MTINPRHCQWKPVFALLFVVFLTAGCQSTSQHRGSNADIKQAMPGKMVRASYPHIIAAVSELGNALSSKEVRLNEISFDSSLTDNLPISLSINEGMASDALQQLVHSELSGTAPYQFIQADAATGRLEYRSTQTRAHLAVTVRAPTTQEQSAGIAFVVAEMFGQKALSDLMKEQTADNSIEHSSSGLWRTSNTSPGVNHVAQIDDNEYLAYLESFSRVEREREDILGERALLMMRLGQENRAISLMQKGIIRYPDSILFYVLTDALFERRYGTQASTQSDTLLEIMQQRFSKNEIVNGRRYVAQYLSE